MGIEAIDKGSVHKITSGQVIVDLVSAVKELVENALDARATSVEVRLKEHGSELIEVADNGCGIRPEDYEAFALKYHTSKISSFIDVSGVRTFGFRGEAISSLCAVSSLAVTTRISEQDVATKLAFDRTGALIGKEVSARSAGTTVSLKDLFKSLPVRHKAFQKNLKKEFIRLVHILQAYAVVSTGVRFIVTNQVKKAARTTVVSTQKQPTMRENFAAVFGAKAAMNLELLSLSNDTFAISGLVSSAVKTSGKTNGHPQFFFINSRPVDLPKAVRVVNDCYRSLSSPATAGCKAVCVINIQAQPDLVDVNITPDKRSVLIQKESGLLDLLRTGLEDVWDPAKWQGVQSISKKMRQNHDKNDMASRSKQQQMCSHFEKPGENDHDHSGMDASVQQDPNMHSGDESVPLVTGVSAASPPFNLKGRGVPAGGISTTAKQLTDKQNLCLAGSQSASRQKSPRPPTHTDPLAALEGTQARKRKHGTLAAALARSQDGGEGVRGRVVNIPVGSTGRGLTLRSPGKLPKQLGSGHVLATEAVEERHAVKDSCVDDHFDKKDHILQEGGHDNTSNTSKLDATASSVGDIKISRTDSSMQPEPTAEKLGVCEVKLHGVLEACFDSIGQHQARFAECVSDGVGREDQINPGIHTPATVIAAHSNCQSYITRSIDRAVSDHGPLPLVPLDSRRELTSRQRGHDLASSAGGMQEQPQPGDDAEFRSAGGVDMRQLDEKVPLFVHLEARQSTGRDEQMRADQNNLADTKGSGRNEAVQHHRSDLDDFSNKSKPAHVTRNGGEPRVSSPQTKFANTGTCTPVHTTAACEEQTAEHQAVACNGASAGQLHQLSNDGSCFKNFETQWHGPQVGGVLAMAPADHVHRESAPGGIGAFVVYARVCGMKARRAAVRGQKCTVAVNTGTTCSFRASSLQALSASVDNQREDMASGELEQRFNKKDFTSMSVHGQFNHGFIMASIGQELFIVDQHAADEKSTFEHLQDNLALNKQPLIAPLDLGLPSVDDFTVRENLDLFTQNGFGFTEDPATGKMRLSSVPFSKGTTFGAEDIHEMIGMIHNGETSRVYVGDKRTSAAAVRCRIRPSKVRAMLAMRACRSSIMVGTVLNFQRMQSIVSRLAELDGPWNCPHGRPTLRHVCTLPAKA